MKYQAKDKDGNNLGEPIEASGSDEAKAEAVQQYGAAVAEVALVSMATDRNDRIGRMG